MWYNKIVAHTHTHTHSLPGSGSIRCDHVTVVFAQAAYILPGKEIPECGGPTERERWVWGHHRAWGVWREGMGMLNPALSCTSWHESRFCYFVLVIIASKLLGHTLLFVSISAGTYQQAYSCPAVVRLRLCIPYTTMDIRFWVWTST